MPKSEEIGWLSFGFCGQTSPFLFHSVHSRSSFLPLRILILTPSIHRFCDPDFKSAILSNTSAILCIPANMSRNNRRTSSCHSSSDSLILRRARVLLSTNSCLVAFKSIGRQTALSRTQASQAVDLRVEKKNEAFKVWSEKTTYERRCRTHKVLRC